MTVEGRSDTYLYVRFDARNPGHDSRKVPLQVKAERQEVRYDEYPRSAAAGESRDGFRQVRSALFEERRFDQLEPALARYSRGDYPHSLVRRRHARPMSEYHNPCLQALLWT